MPIEFLRQIDTYTAIVVLTGVLLIALTWYFLRRLVRRRRQLWERRDILNPVIVKRSEAPNENSLRRRAAVSLSRRVSIISTIFVSLIVLLLAVFLAFPYLDQLPRTLISILVGSSAVISGMAFRPVIENFTAGVVITFARPFRIGDTVLIDGHYGTIEDITSINTILKIWDWRRYVIPNGRMISKEFINYTLQEGTIWTKVSFWVAYDADLEKVKELAKGSAGESKHLMDQEEASFWIMDLQRDGYQCWVAAWADSPATAWELGNDIRTSLIMSFQQHGIRAQSFRVHQGREGADEH